MQKVILYFGKGVDSLSGLHCYKALKELLPYEVQRIKSHQFDAIDFEKCALFVMPGGRDIFYHEALKGKRAAELVRYVEEGGSYLGICAGGYYGSSEIEFERGQPLEVIQKRELQFFPGKAIGSALGLGMFEYQGYGGADVATIVVGNEKIPCFFNGGCYFERAEQYKNTSILARFEQSQKPAVIACKVKQGTAILSGVHFEYFAHLLKVDHLKEKKLEILKKSASMDFMKSCLELFNC